MNKINLTNRELLLLLSVKGIGFERLKTLVSLNISYSEIKQWESKKWISLFGKIDVYRELKNIDSKTEQRIQDTLDFSDKTISYWDNDYPEPLKQIPNPPPLLFLKGNIEILNTKSIGVIGTRNISPYGKFSTFSLTNNLVDNHFTIVSGFARGVDSVAHQTTIQRNGHTIAVLGCGLDVVYPKENKLLYESILSNKGLLISEFLLKTKPDAPNFPKRNRIIAALSEAILVIEAGKKSGSLITAEMALDFGKEIFALPGQINSKQSEGTNHLIKDGAHLVQDINDIISILEPKAKPVKQLNLFSISDSQRKIIDLLSKDPVHIDEISTRLKLPTNSIFNDLLLLELDNHISDIGGKNFILNISL